MSGFWATERLGDHISVQNGYAFSSSDYVNDGHFVMRISNVQNGYVSQSDPKYIKLPTDGSLDRFVLVEGDILMSLTGNIGRVGLVEVNHLPAVLNQRVARIKVRPDSELSKSYLLYFLQSDEFREVLSSAGRGVAQQNVSTKELVEIKFPVPPVQEQRHIVAILDEAFEAIATAKANTEKSLQNARDVLDGFVAQQLLDGDQTWSAKKLRDLCVVDWGNTNLTKSAYVEGGEFLAVSAAGCDGRIGHREHSAHTPVLSAIGAQCGRMFLPTEDFTAIKNTITLTPRKGICSGPFLYRLLTAIKLPKRGAAQPFMAKGDIQEFVVRTPDSLEKQNLIVDAVDALELESDRLAALLERKLAALDELKKSLLHQAFTGQLTAKSTDQQLEAVA